MPEHILAAIRLHVPYIHPPSVVIGVVCTLLITLILMSILTRPRT